MPLEEKKSLWRRCPLLVKGVIVALINVFYSACFVYIKLLVAENYSKGFNVLSYDFWPQSVNDWDKNVPIAVVLWVLITLVTIIYTIFKGNESIHTQLLDRYKNIENFLEKQQKEVNDKLILIQAQNTQSWREHLDIDIEQWKDFIRYKEIVFNVDMTESYDAIHIKNLQERLLIAFPSNGHHEGESHIYAIDATSPRKWWSNSMLGYLAVQADWKAKDVPPQYKRSVARIFVMHPLDIRNPLGKKMIILHQLFGFDTYVVIEKPFQKLFNELKSISPFKEEKGFGIKEFLAWDGCSDQLATANLGYRSFWNISTPEEKRETDPDDFDNQTAKNKRIKFRNFHSVGEANCYKEFFKKIIGPHRSCSRLDDLQENIKDWGQNGKCIVLKLNTTEVDELERILDGFYGYYVK